MSILKAHFIATAADLEVNISAYRHIIQALKNSGVHLTSSWLDEALTKIAAEKSRKPDKKSWSVIYRENLEAISRSDIVVAEVGNKSFLVGFQVAYALQMKKPILLLARHENVDSVLGVSSDEEIIQFERYDGSSIERIISKFVAENSTGGKNIRFNFFVDRKILNYLKWASLKTGQTKSEVIRSILLKEIDKSKF